VGLIVSAGTSLPSSRACVQLARSYEIVYAGVGLHPMNLTAPIDEATLDALRQLALGEPKVVAMSEIGLDFLPNAPERSLQYQAFREQIRLARELNLPIIFHSREAHRETLALLREERAYEVGGAMHYFQADEATAREAMESGFLISLARPLLRLPHLQAVVRRLPLDRLILETDASPQPWKSNRRNWTEPYHIRMVAQKLAELKGIGLEEVAQVTTANLRRLLGLGEPPSST
jgi:TatD DNase family protein